MTPRHHASIQRASGGSRRTGMVTVVTLAGVEISEQLLAAGGVALLIAGQCLRNALWENGHAWFGGKAPELKPAYGVAARA